MLVVDIYHALYHSAGMYGIGGVLSTHNYAGVVLSGRLNSVASSSAVFSTTSVAMATNTTRNEHKDYL